MPERPCQLYISRMNGAAVDVVRIEARDGRELLSRVDIPLPDFAACLMGLGAVPATFTAKRAKVDRLNSEMTSLGPRDTRQCTGL